MYYSRWCYLLFLPVIDWLCAHAKCCSVTENKNPNWKMESLYRMVPFLFLSFLHHTDSWKQGTSLLGKHLSLLGISGNCLDNAHWPSSKATTAPGPEINLRKPGSMISRGRSGILSVGSWLSVAGVSEVHSLFRNDWESQNWSGGRHLSFEALPTELSIHCSILNFLSEVSM